MLINKEFVSKSTYYLKKIDLCERMISIFHPSKIIKANIKLPASKSISNRVLIIQFLMKKHFKIDNLSHCNDTQDLVQALSQIENNDVKADGNNIIVNVGEAGTSYRFLTALLAIIPGNYELKGSEKLMERPIASLIDALNELGAEIKSNNNNGPLSIVGKELNGGHITIEAGISSQFITALMLVAPYFKDGLTLELKGKIVSVSYIKMTIALMKNFGAKVDFEGNIIRVQHGAYQTNFETFTVESDWTAASYWYAFAALSSECEIDLKGLEKNSLQGDCITSDLFSIYGVKSQFEHGTVKLTKLNGSGFIHIFDFVDNPDLVQTFAFLNAALGLPLQVNNASNLGVKETDRIAAIAAEIKKVGGKLTVNSNDDFYIKNNTPHLIENSIFKTYQDHRMAMAESILAMVFDGITIENEHVVSKSYPDFWKHLSYAGFEINLS